MKAIRLRTILAINIAAVLVTVLSINGNAQDVRLSVVPEQVYKLSDGGKMPTESFMFYIIVNDRLHRDGMKIVESRAELISAENVVQTIVCPGSVINRLRQSRFVVPPESPTFSLRRAYALEELFDIPFIFPQVLSLLKVDKVRVTLHLSMPDATETTLTRDIPIGEYQQKTQFIFPIRGPGIVTQGMWNNGGHSGYGNQYAIDVNALTANYAAMLKDSESMDAFATWGREVIAPAEGEVVYVRNDVPDNGPGTNPESIFPKLSEPMLATAGNAVVISHGGAEYSVLMHMQNGSVRVKKGQTVKQGDVIGRIGNSGDSFGPHLHFQVQTGPELFRHPSVPVKFDNLKNVNLLRGVYFSAK